MHHLLRLSIIAIASAGLTSCSHEVVASTQSPALTPNEGAPVVTDASRYDLQSVSNGWRGSIRYVFTNTTGRTVSLLNCNGQYALRLEQRQGTEWVSAWSPPVQECLSPPIHIAPGASLQGEIEVFAGRPGSNIYPQFAVPQIDGIYRLVIESAFFDYDHSGPPWGDVLPIGQRISSPFEIRTGS